MAYQVKLFHIADDAPLADRIAMKRAHIEHLGPIVKRSVGNRWYDQTRRALAQLRQELEQLEAQALVESSTPGQQPGPGPTDPVCGNCGNPLSQHFVEGYGSEVRTYCNQTTNGDVFTDEPSDSALFDMLVERMPDVYEALRASWKKENGHEG